MPNASTVGRNTLRTGRTNNFDLIAIVAVGRANSAFGTWKMDADRSTFAGSTQPKSLTVRIEPHAKGEVFTLDRIEADGRASTSSTILYFDGTLRTFQDFGCSGTQSSRRVDNQAMEILRRCENGASIKIVRRSAGPQQEIVLDITEQHIDGRRFERHLVLEKQSLQGIAP